MTQPAKPPVGNVLDRLSDEWSDWSLEDIGILAGVDKAREGFQHAANVHPDAGEDTLDALRTVALVAAHKVGVEYLRALSPRQQSDVGQALDILESPHGQRLWAAIAVAALQKRVASLETELALARLGDSAPVVKL